MRSFSLFARRRVGVARLLARREVGAAGRREVGATGRRSVRRLVRVVASLLTLGALLLAGCGTGEVPTFDPASPCDGAARQQMPGAYPELEGRVPDALAGQAPTSRDSGRFCARETLGSLVDAGVSEVRFGGAIWEIGERGGIQMAAFEGGGLTAALLAEEYRQAADRARGNEGLQATTLEIAGRPAWRVDVVHRDSRQAIVVWPSADGRVVQVVVAADVTESDLRTAIAAFR
jgi:hypothetical protein